MVDGKTWRISRPAFFHEDEHMQYRRLLQRPKTPNIKPQPTEVKATIPVRLQTGLKEENGGTLATHTVLSPEFIGSYKNTSSSKLNIAASDTTVSYLGAPSISLAFSSDKLSSSLIVTSSSVVGSLLASKSSATSSPSSQAPNSVALLPLHTSFSSSSSLEYGPDTVFSIPTSSSSFSIHLNSPTTVITTPPRLSHITLIATTSSSASSDIASMSTKAFPSSSPAQESTASLHTTTVATTTTEYAGNPEASTPPSNETNTTDSSYPSSYHSPDTPVVVGSVMGSIAGTAVIIFFIILLLRWRKYNKWTVPFDHGEAIAANGSSGAAPPMQSVGDMSQHRSHSFTIPAILSSLSKCTGFSPKASKEVSSTNASERGFYRVSGRKLASVLQNGGDGYEDNLQPPSALSDCSLNLGSQSANEGSGSLSRCVFTGALIQRDGGIPFKHPSSSLNSLSNPAQQESFVLKPPPRTDAIGRSRSSMDSSLASRFTEEV